MKKTADDKKGKDLNNLVFMKLCVHGVCIGVCMFV